TLPDTWEGGLAEPEQGQVGRTAAPKLRVLAGGPATVTAARPAADGEDPALVVAARNGDRRALQALFTSCRGFVRARARALVGDHRDLEDIVQSALMQAARSLPSLREEKFFRTWLAKVTL